MARDESDVLVIGAGAAGCRIARALAEAGRSVTIMEAGPGRETSDLVSSQIWARRLKWGGAPVLHAPGDGFSFTLNAGSGAGGAAAHHYACWPRLHEDDFRMRSLHGRGADWPIAYEDLRPWYDLVQEEVGVSGDAAQEVWRPPGAPYPQKPLPTLAQGEALRRGFSALDMRTAPTPAAILTEPRDGRAACVQDGWCDAGCPIGALWNPLVADLPKAVAAGAVLRTGCQATRVVARGDRATGVDYVEGGRRGTHRAAVIVLALGSVQTPRLLLASAPGLRDRSGLVGTHFMSHGLVTTMGLLPDETEPAQGVSAGQLICQDGYGKERPDSLGSYQYQIAPAAKPNDIFGIAVTRPDLFGARLTAFMTRAVRHFASLAGQFEHLPQPGNRIELDDATDAAGMRLARVTLVRDADSDALQARVTEEGARLMTAAGATEVWHGPLARAHMNGGARMGSDPAASVADGYGRLHGMRNVLVAGSSLFPTAGAVNPTFTIHALAARTAEHLKQSWSTYAG